MADHARNRDERPGLAARETAAAILAGVIDSSASLETLLDERNGLAWWRRLPPRDQALSRAIATAALRHRGRISAAINRLAKRRPPERARHLLHALHVAAAQILFLDVPSSAAVNLAVASLSAEPRSARFAGFANAILRRMAAEKDALADLPADARTVFPAWLSRQLASDHGRERADAIAAMVLCEPVIDLSLHPGLSPAEVDGMIAEAGAVRLPTGSARILDNRPVRDLPRYADGVWWVQDAAAGLPARLLGDVGGRRVADLCAAPGGKTAQLAGAGARVTAVDLSAARLQRLRANLDRLRLSADIVEADILDWRPDQQFDAVLLDAPCTATGTMRRHPDIIWNRGPADVSALAGLQHRMVLAAADMVRPGGTLVYANCSLLKAEGEDLFARLARENERLVPVPVRPEEVGGEPAWINGQGALRTLPCDLAMESRCAGGIDGFFACRFQVAG